MLTSKTNKTFMKCEACKRQATPSRSPSRPRKWEGVRETQCEPSTLQQTPSPSPSQGEGGKWSDARRRGSVVLMVVVALIMMVLLGAVYLQSTRVQRFAISNNEGDIDSVTQAIIAQIQATLTDDLINGDELYDYPWTNSRDKTNPDDQISVQPLYGNAATAYGGLDDDMWLASSEPDFSVSGEWPHITNLNGYFLGWDNDAASPTPAPGFVMSGTHPREDIVNFNPGDNNTDTDIALNTGVAQSKLLVDADGDGIPDSRWTWATIPQISSFTYTMAVRIVDLSGKVNVNTATSVSDASGRYDGSATGVNAPHWDTPAGLDLGRFVWSLNGNMTELTNLLNYRHTGDGVPMTYAERSNYWDKQGQFYLSQQPNYTLYGTNDAYELLYKNGLNNDAVEATIEGPTASPTDGMTTFLRRDNTTATDYNAVDLTQYGGSASPTKQDYFEHEPRHQMTVLSGAAVFAPPLPDSSGNPTTLDPSKASAYKVDLRGLTNTTLADRTKAIKLVSNRIQDVYTSGSGTFTSYPGNISNVANFADQFTVDMADYADKDSMITEYTDGTVNFYGLEALPFISEVYTQAKYKATGATPNATAGWDVTWTLEPEPAGYAIELRNPFRKPADLTTVHLVVDGTDWGKVSDLAGQNELAPMEVLVLYKKSAGQSTGDDDVSQLFDTTNASYTYTPKEIITTSDPFYATKYVWPVTTTSSSPEDVKVELRPTVLTSSSGPTGTVASWPYDAITSHDYPKTYQDTGIFTTLTASPQDQSAYWQSGRLGDGRGLNILAIKDGNYVKVEILPKDQDDPATTPAFEDYDATKATWHLAQEDKGNTNHTAALDNQQILISDADKFYQAGEIAHVAVLGPAPAPPASTAPDYTVRDMWNGVGNVNEFMLNFNVDSASPPLAQVMSTVANSNYDVPYADFLLTQFTTLSPRNDGKNNNDPADNQTDDDSENIVPGLVNLNTAPKLLLDKILPIPNAVARAKVLDFIMAYRRGDAVSPDPTLVTNAQWTDIRNRANPGIAFDGELYNLLSAILTRGLGVGDNPILTDSNGGGNVKVDFLSNPTDTTADGIADDREEADTLSRWLGQVGATRSDYYAAYILVHEYGTKNGVTDFTQAGITDSKWVIVIFQRNAANDKVVVSAILPSAGLYTMQ